MSLKIANNRPDVAALAMVSLHWVTASTRKSLNLLVISQKLMQKGCRRHMHASVDSAAQQLSVISPTEQSTNQLAALIAKRAIKGDCICLHGDVGAGKSVFRSVLSSFVNKQMPCCESYPKHKE